MVDAAQRNAFALLDHAVERIAGAGNDRAVGRPAGRLNPNSAGRVVLAHEEVILQQFAQREGRAEVSVARSEFERQARIDLPTVLPEKFQAVEAEGAEELAVALINRRVVAEKHVGEGVASITRIVSAWSEVKVDRIGPGRLLAVAVHVEEDS